MADWHSPDCFSKELDEYCQKEYNCTFYNGECISYEEYCIAHGYLKQMVDKPNEAQCDTNTSVSDVIKENAIKAIPKASRSLTICTESENKAKESAINAHASSITKKTKFNIKTKNKVLCLTLSLLCLLLIII